MYQKYTTEPAHTAKLLWGPCNQSTSPLLCAVHWLALSIQGRGQIWMNECPLRMADEWTLGAANTNINMIGLRRGLLNGIEWTHSRFVLFQSLGEQRTNTRTGHFVVDITDNGHTFAFTQSLCQCWQGCTTCLNNTQHCINYILLLILSTLQQPRQFGQDIHNVHHHPWNTDVPPKIIFLQLQFKNKTQSYCLQSIYFEYIVIIFQIQI